MGKKLAVAALLALFAVSAFASNFRGADQVYVPIAGKSQSNSGLFVSDMFLANLTNDEVEVSVIFQPFGANVAANPIGIEFARMITLKAQERREFPDFIETLKAQPGWAAAGNPLALGLVMFNGCKKGASCGPETQDQYGNSPNYRAISATSRIYALNNPAFGAGKENWTTGQLFNGIPWYSYVSSLSNQEGLDKVFIQGLRVNSSFRSNIGVVNASQYNTTDIVVTLYQGSISVADRKGEAVITLGPLGNVQFSLTAAQLFGSLNLNGTNYMVTIEQRNNRPTPDAAAAGCTQGCPAFLAYGSVLDNNTNDATTLEPQYLVPLSSDAIDVIYPSAGKPPIRRAVRH